MIQIMTNNKGNNGDNISITRCMFVRYTSFLLKSEATTSKSTTKLNGFTDKQLEQIS